LNSQLPPLENIHAFIFDFDGVMTDNKVYVNQDGLEMVSCNRSDGLAFDVLNKLKKPAYIVSSEKNLVVNARAKKLNIPAIYGVDDKVMAIKKLADTQDFNLKNIMYVGNDINDYKAMQLCGLTACPSDSHELIKSISNIILKKEGGAGVVRELLEEILNINFVEILYD
jgi:N-acylneuraminate cytidylyltransferase/3-deoxy-D-manno-octulosonate 8-phosphate phosphatase (KDO 8-P phosphatase)